MNINLDHLSEEELSELKTRYYQGESVYQLVAEYDLRIAPSMFHKLLPPEQIEEYGCGDCKVHLVADAPPRTKHTQERDPKQFFCPICGKRPFADNHGWITFPLLSDEEIARKKALIKTNYESRLNPIEYDTLPLTTKIYIAVLCTALLDKDGITIRPMHETTYPLASTQDLQEKLYDKLLKCGAIVVSPDSPLDAFDLNAKHFPRKYDKSKVTYRLNLIFPNDKSISDIIACPEDMEPENSTETLHLWKEIAIGECISYLQYRLGKIGFDFSPGPKTHMVFQKLLENFSVSQIYYIIWCKVNDASRWYLEGNVSRPQAANSVIGACLRYGETAVFYERELPQYHRPANCPQGILTQYFYNNILKLGQEADNVCPDLYRLEVL